MRKLMIVSFATVVLGASGLAFADSSYELKIDAPKAKKAQKGVAKIHVTPGAGFHVNKDYPTKFKAEDIANVEFQGTDPAGKNVFSKAKNDFVLGPDDAAAKGPVTGWMTVTFKGKSAGAAKITGKLKLSVCNEANCQMETADVSVPVTVK